MLQLLRSTSCVKVNFLFSSSLRNLFDISAGILHHFALGREQKSELIWLIKVYHGFEILSTSLVEVSSAQSLSTASYWSMVYLLFFAKDLSYFLSLNLNEQSSCFQVLASFRTCSKASLASSLGAFFAL